MPNSELGRALRESTVDVLEKMFFAQPLEEPAGDLPGAVLAVKLAFEGAPSGALTLTVTEDAARQIAADFLGEDENEISGRKVEEVTCELANMICGSVLSRVESQATFRLASPQLLAAEAWRLDPHPGEARVVHSVALEKGKLTAVMETH